MAAALVTLLANWVNTNGENLLFRVIQESLAVQASAEGITDERGLQEFIRDGTTGFSAGRTTCSGVTRCAT